MIVMSRAKRVKLLLVVACVIVGVALYLNVTLRHIISSNEIVQAARARDFKLVKSMVAKKPKLVNARDLYGNTLLYWTVERGDKEMVVFLLGKGADVNASTLILETALHTAVFVGNTEITKILIDNGAKVNAILYYYGQTPIHLAAQYGHKEIVQMLINAGADVNATDADGKTPADLAAENNHPEIVELLRKHSTVE